MKTAWIRQTTHLAPNVGSAIEVFEANQEATYSVAWIDCLAGGAAVGRSLVMLGEHAGLDDLSGARRKAPFDVPKKARRAVPFDDRTARRIGHPAELTWPRETTGGMAR